MQAEHLQIGGSTAVYGVIGDPIEHTLSPLMHNRALAAMGLDAVYLPFHVEPGDLRRAVMGMRAFGIRGLNVTVPHKSAVMEHLDLVTDAAKAVGAVNTIINHNGELAGENTDVYGILMCLETAGGLKKFPESVCILGAGGAARAVVHACAQRSGVREIFIVNRTVDRARTLASDMESMTGAAIVPLPPGTEDTAGRMGAAGLIINTTSVGMHPHTDASPVPDTTVFHRGQTVCDIIYNPFETRLLREASDAGANTVGGLAMLAYQGARALSLWTRREPPVDIMLETLKDALEKRRG